jgi:hypothetical protein
MKPYLQQYFEQEEVMFFWPEEIDPVEAIIVSASGWDVTSLLQEDRKGNGYIDYNNLEYHTLRLLNRFCDAYNISRGVKEVEEFRNFVLDGGLKNDVWDLYQNYPYFWEKVVSLLDEKIYPLLKQKTAAIVNIALWRSRNFFRSEVK